MRVQPFVVLDSISHYLRIFFGNSLLRGSGDGIVMLQDSDRVQHFVITAENVNNHFIVRSRVNKLLGQDLR